MAGEAVRFTRPGSKTGEFPLKNLPQHDRLLFFLLSLVFF